MPRALHFALPLHMMLFANLSPKPEPSRLRSKGGTAWTAHHSWLHLHPCPGARGTPFLQGSQEGPCKPPALEDGTGAVSGRRESLLSCSADPAPALAAAGPPWLLQVPPAEPSPGQPRLQPGTADTSWALPLPSAKAASPFGSLTTKVLTEYLSLLNCSVFELTFSVKNA